MLATTASALTLALLLSGSPGAEEKPKDPCDDPSLVPEEKTVTKPVPVHFRPPPIKYSLISSARDHRVLVSTVISCKGRVLEAEIKKGVDPRIDRIVLKTVQKWWFKPALVDKVPVAVHFELTVNILQEEERSRVRSPRRRKRRPNQPDSADRNSSVAALPRSSGR